MNKIETALAAHAAELIAQEASLAGKLDKVTGTLESVSILSADTIVSLLGDAEIAAAAALASAPSTEEQTGEPEEQEPEEQGQEGDG